MSTDALGALSTRETDEASKSGKSRDKLATDMSMFLNMLTTQLKHQDPLSPMDSTEFTNQLVMFSQVEQQISGNEHMEKLLKVQQSSQLGSAVNYMDKHIEAAGNQIAYDGGETAFSYELPGSVDATEILVKDALGRIVATLDGETQAGRHEIAWDGTSDTGATVDPGIYTVEANTTSGSDTGTAPTFVGGLVTGVAADENGIILSLGGLPVPLEDVRSVTQPAAS